LLELSRSHIDQGGHVAMQSLPGSALEVIETEFFLQLPVRLLANIVANPQPASSSPFRGSAAKLMSSLAGCAKPSRSKLGRLGHEAFYGLCLVGVESRMWPRANCIKFVFGVKRERHLAALHGSDFDTDVDVNTEECRREMLDRDFQADGALVVLSMGEDQIPADRLDVGDQVGGRIDRSCSPMKPMVFVSSMTMRFTARTPGTRLGFI
jgi:hypothetical protein